MEKILLEAFGYMGSILVAVSLSMSNLLKLRIYNLIGALAFTIYAIIIHAYPVAAVNGYITIIDIYYLLEMRKKEDMFELMRTESDNDYLGRFLEHYTKDILKFFPSFKMEYIEKNLCVILLRNLQPVGLFVYKKETNSSSAKIIIDYVIPEYRDMKNGNFLFTKQNKFFKEQNICKLFIDTENKEHIQYISKLGFNVDAENSGRYNKIIM